MKTVDFLQLWLSMPRETVILNAPVPKEVTDAGILSFSIGHPSKLD